VDQIQVVQRSRDDVEVRYARRAPLSPAEEQAVTQAIHEALGHPFPSTFVAVGSIARQPNGKYETFYDDGRPRHTEGSTLT
jgi:hypothetical protein